MKKILIIILASIFSLSYAEDVPIGVPTTGTVVGGGFVPSSNTFATHYEYYGKGGFKAVANITERNTIIPNRRKLGMAVYVLDADGSSNPKLFILTADTGTEITSDTNWTEFAPMNLSSTTYAGVWDADTNIPVLIDGTGTAGDLYITGIAGSKDLGSGSITFSVGDKVVYDGSKWQKVEATDKVTSVNGKIGVVTLTANDVSAVPLSQKGVNDGVATLDSSGKVPSSQLNVSATSYKGIWDADTNTPTIVSGAGTTGDLYIIGAAGSTEIDGISSWIPGDNILFNGTAWEKTAPSDKVASVNGKIGVVTLNAGDVLAISISEKGVNSGVATLDASGKVPASQLNLTSTQYKGLWNATTNIPTLADGAGLAGDFYITGTAGTTDLGSGNLTLIVGDNVLYNGTIWEKVTPANSVVSVAGKNGVVSLDTTDITYTNAGFPTLTDSDLALNYLLSNNGIKKVYDKTAAPTITDDSASDFAVGSVWIDITNDKAYLCIDATTGAAIWAELAKTESVLSVNGKTGIVVLDATDVSAIPSSEKGTNSGVATLDASGKVPASQLNVTSTIYKGSWNSSTNIPAIVSSVGTLGDLYVVSVAGSTTIDGTSSWLIGDNIVFNGTIWEKVTSADQVISVNSKIGVVTLNADDVLAIPVSEKGVNSGVATLDASGKVPASQLNVSATQYKGLWNATANSPTIADGAGISGDLYITTTAGTVDLGSGNLTFIVGDNVLYNGTIWEKVTPANSVVSVAGKNGVVSLDTTDITYTNAGFPTLTDSDLALNYLLNNNGIKNVYDKTAMPTVTDDSDSDFADGSLWLDITNDKAYICTDATVGVAVWKEITNGSSSAGEGIVLVSTVDEGASGNISNITMSSGTVASCVSDDNEIGIFVKASVSSTTHTPSITLSASGAADKSVPMSWSSSEGLFTGNTDFTFGAATEITATHSDGATTTFTITTDAGPVITPGSVSFENQDADLYPGSQTEVKEDDTVWITATADEGITAVMVTDSNACKSGNYTTFVNGTNSGDITVTVSVPVANKGNTATNYTASIKGKDSNGAWSQIAVATSNQITLNNVAPSISWAGGVTYPAGQSALKGTEDATVNHIVSNSGASPTISYTSAELTITSSSTYEPAKTVSCNAATYRDSGTNLSLSVTRSENDNTLSSSTLVYVANTAYTLTVTEDGGNDRLRSGGALGTSVQEYTVTITSTQNLKQAPTLAMGVTGTWKNANFAGSNKIWTNIIQVNDTDTKGTHNWGVISAANIANTANTTITGNTDYIFGGFVKRRMTVAAYSRTAGIGTEAVTTSKLQCTNLSEGSEGSLNYIYKSDTADENDRYTLSPDNSTWYNCDSANAGSNTTGTMTIDIEETK